MNKYAKGIGFYILLFIVILSIFFVYRDMPAPAKTYSDLYSAIKSGNVVELVIMEQTATAILRDGSRMEVTTPPIEAFYQDLGEDIRSQVESNSLKFDFQIAASPPWWITILPTLILVIIFVVFWVFFLQQSQGGGGGKVMQFGKSKARMVSEDSKKYTFKDVAGADEEKAELEEIVEFLKMPKKFIELGARIPRGVLLVGPPGTGKTLLAKAVAGEAGVPFFSISGSDFVEMFVGVGASRVRDLFEQAKKNSPSIVFIDEIDAVGRHRGAGLGGGHDEREQTLNQLLVEMDGFGDNQGVIIIAATNRPDILDPALLRPGRFDRQVVVGAPDVKGREEVLKVHTVKKPLGEDVDLSILAKTTAGFTGADLENLANEAALLSARRGKTVINMKEFEDAIIKVIAGPEKKARVITEKERKLTAYHEAGHAVVTKLLPTQDPVHQISIIPRGRAGGYTLSLPKEDKYYASKNDMFEEIVVLLGGRVAEKLVLDDISTGASNDIERATSIARNMVVKYGMSEALGPMTFGSPHSEVFLGKDYAQTRNYSETVAAKIDEEIKAIIDGAYKKCEELLKENISKLHAVSNALLEREKINAEEFEEIFENS
ncbi:MAG: ATP-dependent zinc metalloprotease FtsH [Eubacteriales bacterium]|jgi:cell division protease FtsH|nr:ATP-dependent zinc metalloprotease FtsH [Eubacteriales bacterium]